MTSTEQSKQSADLPTFRQTGQTLLHQSWFISLYRGTFENPRGTTFDREIVRHPGAVAIVPVTDERSVLLVHQYRPSVDRWLLEIPAGTCDVAGEPAVETARRELGEEVGRTAKSFVSLIKTLNTPGFCDEVTEIFLATGLQAVPTDRQGLEEEYLTVVDIPLRRFDRMVDDGRVVDAATVLGVGLARRQLRQR